MTRGRNFLLEDAYRNLAKASNRIEWFVVGVCVVWILILGVWA